MTIPSWSSTSSVRRVRIRPECNDLEIFLGPSEAEMMRVLWGPKIGTGPWTIRKVKRALRDADVELSPSAIQTTLDRLAEKGFVLRVRTTEGITHWLYSATLTRAEFIEAMLRQTLSAFVREFSEVTTRIFEEVST